uniref:DNA (cytosine-5-)-methyltransferase n=1 Tax=viral metagenome TaxID=1070528 RepID=A0A6C0DR23_9ZZZZ
MQALRDECKKRGIKGYSGKTKAELVKLLEQPVNEIVEPGHTAARPRFIDLFSGLGAFHTAFAKDFECVFACDINEGARAIYKANYGLEPAADIREVDANALPDFEILCAGFPCQPFSIAGNQEGFKDQEKGNLFFDVLRIMDAKRPKVCILENVKNLETHDEGRTFKRIKDELEKRGYTVSAKVLNAANYGSPQARQRIFIMAVLGGPAFVFPESHKTIVPVASIIDPTMTAVWNSAGYTLVPMPSAGLAGQAATAAKPRILYNVVSDKTKRGGRQGERVYDTAAVGITICASSGGPGAKTGLYKVGGTANAPVVRRLTVKEGLGMFGFPATYKFPGVGVEDALFYLGNSIVVNVPTALLAGVKACFM